LLVEAEFDLLGGVSRSPVEFLDDSDSVAGAQTESVE
jgi:hypothetical protein